jgi:ribonuclease-3
MSAIDELIQKAPEIEAKLGYSFNNRALLALAFVHRSFINEHREVKEHNERLEFLGDSVLSLLVSEYLYIYLPSTSEGDLSYLRSRIVEASSCVAFTQKLDIEQYLLLGRGERMSDGRGRDSIMADLFEAVVGAIYLDRGLEAAKSFFFKNFSKEINAILEKPDRNWKAILQDYCQKKFQQPPVYQVLSEEGPDHNKTFLISVRIRNQEFGRGQGSSKKEAQQAAAADALSHLEKE